MSYRCEFKSNWPCLCREERLNRGRSDRIRSKADPGSSRSKRNAWATDKFYRRHKNVTAASLLLRVSFELFGEANGARSSIIDGGFCVKKRTKVIQIAAMLDNERRDRRVNFHAIYDCIRAYYRLRRNHTCRASS